MQIYYSLKKRFQPQKALIGSLEEDRLSKLPNDLVIEIFKHIGSLDGMSRTCKNFRMIANTLQKGLITNKVFTKVISMERKFLYQLYFYGTRQTLKIIKKYLSDYTSPAYYFQTGQQQFKIRKLVDITNHDNISNFLIKTSEGKSCVALIDILFQCRVGNYAALTGNDTFTLRVQILSFLQDCGKFLSEKAMALDIMN